MTTQPTIFVSIAAYRDTELEPTVRDLFEKAKYPGNVHVAICWQYNTLREEPFIVPDRKHQVSVINIDYKKAKGVCWARHTVQKLYSGEDYYLQVDAHSRFVPNWDELMIADLARCNSAKPILSTYPDHYTLPNTLVPHGPYKLVFDTFQNKIPTFHTRACEGEEKNIPSPSAIVSGGFLFSRADAMLEVPYDPNIYFIGEEISMSVRYWTHGYDMFTPTKTLVFHLYVAPDLKKIHHWSDHPDWHGNYEAHSRARVWHLLGIEETTNPKALHQLERYSLGTVRSLSEYEQFAGINFRDQIFSDTAKRGMTANAVPPETPVAAAPPPVVLTEPPAKPAKRKTTAKAGKKERVFVQIASYRDPECQWTVKDLFEKAANPDSVFVGICLQYDVATESAEFVCDTPYLDQVRTICFPSTESQGAGWARAQAHTLWHDEEYILQIDAHMRFEQGWDEKLIETLKRCPSDKPVLSTMLPGYEPPNTYLYREESQCSYVMINYLGEPGDTQLVHLHGGLVSNHAAKPPLKRTPFWVGNFLFARSALFIELPVDPYVYFYGEEITYSTRLWTHGYDIFQPDQHTVYHWWGKGVTPGSTYKSHANERQLLTLKRVKHLVQLETSDDPRAITDLDKYSLGTTRPLESFWKFAGIDLKARTIEDFAKQGDFEEAYKAALNFRQ